MKFGLNKKTNSKKPSAAESRAGSAATAGNESPMDVTLLERLVKLMTANDLNTVDVRDGDKRVILKRGPAGVMSPMQATAPMAVMPHTGAAATSASSTLTPAASEEASLTPIKSPMVGTFYSAPAPDAKPFVTVGSQVDEETDVCVIEAMKVFNNIKAECRGTIAKVLVSNGETVEFGQSLFLVKTA
jgi:acetyl-CoA carboxylase biotin carboxyl carrier protein